MDNYVADGRLHRNNDRDRISSGQRGDDAVLPSRALPRRNVIAETPSLCNQVAADRQSLLCSMTRQHTLCSVAMD